jgi:transposase
MITNTENEILVEDFQDRGEQVSVKKANAIKLGIDVHARQYVVVRQIDHATPQPVQRFTPEEFPKWVAKQQQLGEKVYACYEAGYFGYGLYRQLKAMGVECYVVCPQNWDERGARIKNDQRDALQMEIRLDRYVCGNRDALAIVRVPTEAEEQLRCESRQRDQLLRERKRLQAQGRSLLSSQSIRSPSRWWTKRGWEKLSVQWPAWLTQRLELIRPILLLIEEKMNGLTQRLEAATASGQPRGFGALTLEVIKREVGDWKRFKNRRQVASYTGLCPGQHSSGSHSCNLSITKHGNPRVRHALIETVWRVVMFQPQYAPVQKWKSVLCNPKSTSAMRKKAAVAIGRRLAIDLWRMNTGRCTAGDLNLIVNP